MGTAENKSLNEITDYLELVKLPWFRNRVNETRRNYNCKKIMFIKSGILDTGIILPNGEILFIEVKIIDNKTDKPTPLTESQIKFIDICKANNTPYVVATCAADVRDYLHKKFLGTIWKNRF